MTRRIAVVVVAGLAAACSSGQDPGLTPSTQPGAVTTSRTLPACPAGGPDSTTPAAGCLAEDGTVVRP